MHVAKIQVIFTSCIITVTVIILVTVIATSRVACEFIGTNFDNTLTNIGRFNSYYFVFVF